MDTPLSRNKKRVQIRLLGDLEMTLGVKRKYLEFIQPPPPTMANHALYIDLVVARISTFTEYFPKELRIANDEQYHLVLVVHPNTTSQCKIKSNRFSTLFHQSDLELVISLLKEARSFVDLARSW